MDPADLLPPLPASAPPALHRARAAMIERGFAYYREGPHGAPVVIPNVHGVQPDRSEDTDQ